MPTRLLYNVAPIVKPLASVEAYYNIVIETSAPLQLCTRNPQWGPIGFFLFFLLVAFLLLCSQTVKWCD